MFERLIEAIFRSNEKDRKIRELEARLEKAEAAADAGSRMVRALHRAGGSLCAEWKYEAADPNVKTFGEMADEVVEAYGKEGIFGTAWPAIAGPAGAEREQGEARPPLPSSACGRKVVGGDWDVVVGGWNLVLEPVILSPQCGIKAYSDGSGRIEGPGVGRIADWDFQTCEAGVLGKSGMYYLVCEPFDPCGYPDFEAMLLDKLEIEVSAAYPELVLADSAA